MKVRVLLVEDHPIFRDALKMMLENDPRIEIVGEAGDGSAGLRLAAEARPDVVIMDIGMPRMDGVEATRRIVSANPSAKVIALSARTDQDFVLDMLRAGASGYVAKSEASEELMRAIFTVCLNRKYLCPEVASSVTGALLGNGDGRSVGPTLGQREKQVLQLVSEGMTSPQIADSLHVATSTVEVHRRNIMRKLDLHTVAGLTKYAIRKGMTTTSN